MYTKDYLLIGSAVHAGLAAYYLSGWKDGKYSLEAALLGARSHLEPRKEECESEDKWAASQAESERILRGYAKEYATEYPTLRVADKDGEPLVEYTFTYTLRTGHTLTVRPDMVAWNFDSLVCVEHKVPAAQSVTRTVGEAGLGGQGLAPEAILQSFGLPTNGQLINILVRGGVHKLLGAVKGIVQHGLGVQGGVDEAGQGEDFFLDFPFRHGTLTLRFARELPQPWLALAINITPMADVQD